MKTYIAKLEAQEKECVDQAKEYMKSGNKERALIHMKKKKFIGKELEKAIGADGMLEQSILDVESAQ